MQEFGRPDAPELIFGLLPVVVVDAPRWIPEHGCEPSGCDGAEFQRPACLVARTRNHVFERTPAVEAHREITSQPSAACGSAHCGSHWIALREDPVRALVNASGENW